MEGFGERVSRRESVEMIRHADIDGDGRVDYVGKIFLNFY